jgi:hypothetical protein
MHGGKFHAGTRQYVICYPNTNLIVVYHRSLAVNIDLGKAVGLNSDEYQLWSSLLTETVAIEINCPKYVFFTQVSIISFHCVGANVRSWLTARNTKGWRYWHVHCRIATDFGVNLVGGVFDM